MPYIKDVVAAYGTLGEIHRSVRQEFGHGNFLFV